MSMKKKLDQPLKVLNLSARAHSALSWWIAEQNGRAPFPASDWGVTIADVVSLSDDDLRRCPNFGKASAAEFRFKLANYLGNAKPLAVGERAQNPGGRAGVVVFVSNGKACLMFNNGDIDVFAFSQLSRP
jgi:hypothetical protein